MSSYSSELLQEKLSRLNSTQESIETLSLWIIHHKQYASTSISTWMEDMKSGNADRRLLLLYLANDVLQNGKRKGADIFMELFKDPLKESMQLISGQKIQTSVERMIRIWKERKIFKNNFLSELTTSLAEPEKKIEMPQSPPKVFQLSLLADAMNEMEKFEGELAIKRAGLQALRLNVADPSTLMQLKDKSAGGKFSEEFEEASQKLQEYCGLLSIEVDERTSILEMVIECTEEQKQFYAKVQTVYEEHKQLSQHVVEFLNKLCERQKELERAQSTSTSDPMAKEDITEEGDMEIDSGDELAPQPQQQAITKQQQVSHDQLNTVAQTMQVFPNLLPAIQQQLQQTQQQRTQQLCQQPQHTQQQQQQQQRSHQQQSSYIMPNLTSNYLTLLPTPTTSAVRPAFVPISMPAQPRNLPPLLPPSLPAMPLTQPGLSSLNISQLAPPIAAIPSSQYQQQVRPPSVNQSLTPLPANILNNQLNSVVLHNQPPVPYRNNQQVIGALNGAPRQSFNQQQVGCVPTTSSLQPLPTVASSWPASNHSTFTTSSADHTPLFLKAARANAAPVNIAPAVTHPPSSAATHPPPSLAATHLPAETRLLQSLPVPQLPVATLPTSLQNATTGLITPYSQVATGTPVNVVQPSSLSLPIMAQAKPVTTTTLVMVTPHPSSSSSSSSSSAVLTTKSTAVTTTPSATSALALASSLVPGLDTEVLQSILRTVKIGSGNKPTTSADTIQVGMDESSEVMTNTVTIFKVDDVLASDPNIVMFGERKRKPSNEKEDTLLVDSCEPDAKLAKVDNPISKANVPPWLQGGGGAHNNGPISCSASDDNSKEQSGLLLAGKEQTPSRPYFRDVDFEHGPAIKNQQQSTSEDEAPYSFEDNDYEPFDVKMSFVKDYGHGQKPSSMDYNHGKGQFPGDQKVLTGSQEVSKEQGSDKFLSVDDQHSGSESPDTDQGLFIKDQEVDQESPVKGKAVDNQESMDVDLLDQKLTGDQECTSVPASISDQGALMVYQTPGHGPFMTDQRPIPNQRSSHGPPMTDQRPIHGSPIPDQRSSHGPPMTDQRPIHGPPIADQRSSHGPPMTDQRPIHGPPIADQRSSHGPPMTNQRPIHGPPIADQRSSHGSPMTDQRHNHEHPITDQGPIYMTDQRRSFALPGDQRSNYGPPMRDQVLNITDQRILSRGQEPLNNDQRHKGFPVGDQGPLNIDHVLIRNQEGMPTRDYRFPIRNQWPPVRGFPMRGQDPPVRFTRDQGLNAGEPGRDQGYFVRSPVGNQGPLREQQLGPPDNRLVSDQGLSQGQVSTTSSTQGSQGNVEEAAKDQGASYGKEQKPNQDPPQGVPNRDQEQSHLRSQEVSDNDQGQNRGHSPMRNPLEPNSEHYQFDHPPPDHFDHPPPDHFDRPPPDHFDRPPPDHFDRPPPDKYYRGNNRPPWRPPMGPRRMSPPPFHHHPPLPRNMRFPPPRDSQWPPREYSPSHSQHPPPHRYGHAPPRLPPYRQPY